MVIRRGDYVSLNTGTGYCKDHFQYLFDAKFVLLFETMPGMAACVSSHCTGIEMTTAAIGFVIERTMCINKRVVQLYVIFWPTGSS